MKLKILFTLIAIISFSCLIAQVDDHDHDHHHHKNEIGVANMAVYFVKEEVFAYGLHLHYIRQISASKFGFGVGYEKIFDEHEHQTFGVVVAYRPIERLTFAASPGLTYENEESGGRFAFHAEAVYEFEIGDFHIGPLFEVAYDPEDIHMSLGIHIGYAF